MTVRPAFLIAIAALGAGSPAAGSGKPPLPARPAIAQAAVEPPSRTAAQIINWVIQTHNNKDQPFIVIDKVAAELFVFDASGRALQQTPVLIGIAKGDLSAPGVGDMELSKIPLADRTTPAGRFLAFFGPAAGHAKNILWVDYDNAISLHPVITSNPAEHRLMRLQSPTPADNRITFGCINVDAQFYKTVVDPLFHPGGGVVYVLPEERSLSDVFAGFSPDEPHDGS